MACPQELDTDLVGGKCANVLQAIGFCCVSLVYCCSLSNTEPPRIELPVHTHVNSATVQSWSYVAVLSQSSCVLSCGTSQESKVSCHICVWHACKHICLADG